MRIVFVVWAALLTVQCTAATPTVEDVNAQRAKMESDCKAKGYAPGTQDFQTCITLAATAQEQAYLQQQAIAGATLGLIRPGR